MTLPSPKKRQITLPSTSPARIPEAELTSSLDIQDSYEGPGNWSLEPASRMAGDTVWLPAALLAALVLLASAMRAFGGEADLKWQRPNLPKARATAPTPPPAFRDMGAKPLRKVAKATPSKTYAVRQAGYTEAEGWARSDSNVTRTQLESVVVRRDDQAFEVAQSPDTFPSDTINPLEREIEIPFDGMPQGEEGPLGPDTLPDPNITAPGMDEFDPMMQREDPSFPGREAPVQTPPDTTTQPPVDVEEDRPSTFVPDPRFEFPGSTPIAPERAKGTGIAATPEERAQAQENCEQELASIRASRIASISLEIRPTGEPGRDYPFECSIDDGTPYEGRHWAEITYMWKAAANCHKPLYFEQVHAERYGHSLPPCFQPVCSGAHFFGSLITLPYQMGLTPPNECMYPLGHYRPGNCAPYMVPAVPFTWRAAGAQAGAAVGVAGILP